MLQKVIPKQVKGGGIIPPPRRSLKGCRRCGGAAKIAAPLLYRLCLSLAYHTRETRVGWVSFLPFENKSDRIIALKIRRLI